MFIYYICLIIGSIIQVHTITAAHETAFGKCEITIMSFSTAADITVEQLSNYIEATNPLVTHRSRLHCEPHTPDPNDTSNKLTEDEKNTYEENWHKDNQKLCYEIIKNNMHKAEDEAFSNWQILHQFMSNKQTILDPSLLTTARYHAACVFFCLVQMRKHFKL